MRPAKIELSHPNCHPQLQRVSEMALIHVDHFSPLPGLLVCLKAKYRDLYLGLKQSLHQEMVTCQRAWTKSKGKSCLKATGDLGYFDLGLSGLRDLERTSFTAQHFLKSSVPCVSSSISIKATVIWKSAHVHRHPKTGHLIFLIKDKVNSIY